MAKHALEQTGSVLRANGRFFGALGIALATGVVSCGVAGEVSFSGIVFSLWVVSMAVRYYEVAGGRVPRMIYGTAWKEEATTTCTRAALACGFRGIDTANQRKHYHEAGVGDAIAAAVADGLVRREELFLQTKFTFPEGQDDRLPYDPSAPTAEQVVQSCASSLQHLQTDWIDSYLLHGPATTRGLSARDWEAWTAIEQLHSAGVVKRIGVSNFSADQLSLLCKRARVRPHFVQNRCFAVTQWDKSVRQVCESCGVVYQAFSLLTANIPYIIKPQVREIARRHGRTTAQVIFRFALHLDMIALTGTTDVNHMREDLQAFDFDLQNHEIKTLERIALLN